MKKGSSSSSQTQSSSVKASSLLSTSLTLTSRHLNTYGDMCVMADTWHLAYVVIPATVTRGPFCCWPLQFPINCGLPHGQPPHLDKSSNIHGPAHPETCCIEIVEPPPSGGFFPLRQTSRTIVYNYHVSEPELQHASQVF